MGQPSTAFMARMIDRQKCTIFFDELDSVIGKDDDNDRLSLIRIGQRKGQLYPRMNKNMEPEFFNVYGSKAFSVHTAVEDALLSRSIPITTAESSDATLPLVNWVKDHFSKPILDSLYLWYMDNILYIVDSVSCVDYTNIHNNNKVYDRKGIAAALNEAFGSTQRPGQRTGRSGELDLIITILSHSVGVDIDEKWATEVFELRKEIEEEQQNIGPTALLRDILGDNYKKYAPRPIEDGWRTPENYVKVAHRAIFDEFNIKLKNDKIYNIGQKDFGGFLRELGFDAGNAKRKLRVKMDDNEAMGASGYPSRMALIFTPHVLKKIGIQEIEAQGKLTEEKV